MAAQQWHKEDDHHSDAAVVSSAVAEIDAPLACDVDILSTWIDVRLAVLEDRFRGFSTPNALKSSLGRS